jgi:hypothetical protein
MFLIAMIAPDLEGQAFNARPGALKVKWRGSGQTRQGSTQK